MTSWSNFSGAWSLGGQEDDGGDGGHSKTSETLLPLLTLTSRRPGRTPISRAAVDAVDAASAGALPAEPRSAPGGFRHVHDKCGGCRLADALSPASRPRRTGHSEKHCSLGRVSERVEIFAPSRCCRAKTKDTYSNTL